jgi:hypothetical protein
MAYDQKVLQEFLQRRHPEYWAKIAHWEFLDAAYEGGRGWFVANIFRYIKEGQQEFDQRIARAYRFNHTREAVELINKYIFKVPATRSEDAPKELQEFWKTATLGGLDINQFMKLVATRSSVGGRTWIFVDSNKTAEVVSREDEKAADIRIYAYTVKQQNILDLGFDRLGQLNWVLVRETVRDDGDPIRSSGDVEEQFRLWEKNGWKLFKVVKQGRKVVIEMSEGTHELGFVPCFPVDHTIGEHRYSAPGLIDDIAYLDRAVANYLSNLDAIIQDQTFSQLAMPAQGLLPGDDKYNQLLEMGTKRIFTYDGEGGGQPVFLSPDPSQAGVILQVINKIIGEIYHTIGAAGERTKQDNAVGIDNSSGVAKAYDFERMNSLLASKANSLENAENQLAKMVMAFHGHSNFEDEFVQYPETFDVRGLYDEFSISEQLMLVDAPKEVRREQMKQVVEKLFPQIKKDLLERLHKDIEEWLELPEGVDPLTGAPLPKTVSDPARPNAASRSRQGEVTKETGKSQPK